MRFAIHLTHAVDRCQVNLGRIIVNDKGTIKVKRVTTVKEATKNVYRERGSGPRSPTEMSMFHNRLEGRRKVP